LGETFEQVTFRGHEEDVESQYASAAVVINPCWIGTGLKIKTVDAIARGKPLVTTSKGVEGLDHGIEAACIISDDEREFARGLVHAASSSSAQSELSKRAENYAKTHLNTAVVYQELLDFLNDRR
jgi:glycosyltransferase involved in cell wall biosynthesis